MAAPSPASKAFAVYFGGEDFILDRERMRPRSWTGRLALTLDGASLTDSELVDICQTPSFDGSPRVIILDQANKVKGDKSLRTYIKDKDENDLTTILVAIVRSEKLPEIWALAGKKGLAKEHPKLKTYDDNNEVLKWTAAEAKHVGITLGKEVAERLFLYVGHNLAHIANEIQKLRTLVGRGAEATLEHLKLTLAPSPTAEVWQVAEAVADKDFRRAMNLLSTLYKSEGDDVNVPVVYSLMRQIEKLMVTRYMLDAKMSEADMASAIGMHPYRFKTSLLPMARKHTMPELVHHMGKLALLDSIVKSSARSKRSHVELTVHSIAA